MKKQASALIASMITVAVATTVVLPGRRTPQAIQSFFKVLSNSVTSILSTPLNVAGTTSPTGSGGNMVPVPNADSDGGGGGGFGAR